MIKRLAFLVLFMLSNFSFSDNSIKSTTENVYLTDNKTILYNGDINLSNLEKLKEIYNSSTKKPKLLKINSNGGDIIAGMQMGNWLYDHSFSVEVIDYCISSCANYIFPAGKYKYLNKNAILYWHGGAFSSKIDDVIENETKEDGDLRRAYLKKVQTMELEFYSKINVDKNIHSYGNSDSCYKKFRQEDFAGFFYSLKDMNKMGLKKISVRGIFSSWKPIAKKQVERNVFRVNAVIGSECDIDYIVGSSILLGKDTIKNAMEAASIANLEQIREERSDVQLKAVIFDTKKSTLVFVKSLLNPIESYDKSFFIEEKNRIIKECKHSKKVPFQFESFAFKNSEIMNTWHRYIKNENIIHEIEIIKSDCI